MKVLLIGSSHFGVAIMTVSAALSKNHIVVETIHYNEQISAQPIPLEFIAPPKLEMDELYFLKKLQDNKQTFIVYNNNLIVSRSNQYYYHPLWTRPP